MRNRIAAWTLATAVAAGVIGAPEEAHAFEEDSLYYLPPLIIAAAIATPVIIYAVNNPGPIASSVGDDETSDANTEQTGAALSGGRSPTPTIGYTFKF